MLTFDKTMPLRPQFWVDEVTGSSSGVFSTSGMINRGCVRLLTQEFHPQELNHGPYLELGLLLDVTQIDELIQMLQELKKRMP